MQYVTQFLKSSTGGKLVVSQGYEEMRNGFRRAILETMAQALKQHKVMRQIGEI